MGVGVRGGCCDYEEELLPEHPFQELRAPWKEPVQSLIINNFRKAPEGRRSVFQFQFGFREIIQPSGCREREDGVTNGI